MTRSTLARHFEETYAAHARFVRLVILGQLRTGDDPHMADDLAQDVWLTYWRYMAEGRTVKVPGALLRTIARHKVCDHYRRAHVRREVPTDTTAYGAFDQVAARELVGA